jgi:DNA-binding transcriptional LysR family regulator
LQANIIDAAIAPSGANFGDVLFRNVWSERLMVVIPDGHPLSATDAIFWTDLRREIFVLPTGGVGPAMSDILNSRLSGQGYRANLISQETSLDAILSTVTLGRYISLATEASMGVSWPGLMFKEISDHGSPARIQYALYWRADNENPALKRFFKLIEERYPG